MFLKKFSVISMYSLWVKLIEKVSQEVFDRERSRRGPKNAKVVVVVVGVINFCSTGKNVLLMKSLKYYEILKNIMKSYEIY